MEERFPSYVNRLANVCHNCVSTAESLYTSAKMISSEISGCFQTALLSSSSAPLHAATRRVAAGEAGSAPPPSSAAAAAAGEAGVRSAPADEHASPSSGGAASRESSMGRHSEQDALLTVPSGASSMHRSVSDASEEGYMSTASADAGRWPSFPSLQQPAAEGEGGEEGDARGGGGGGGAN